MSKVQIAGLVAGPVVFCVFLASPVPAAYEPAAWATAAATFWIAIWWFTEALPLAATALLPLLLFPLLGIRPLDTVAAAYADPILFLFLGGFVISQAMQASGLHRRIARFVVKRAGLRPGARLAGIMGATAFLSMWISNTASAIMMVPIALSIAHTMSTGAPERDRASQVALLLGVAYGASIGGVATLIGTPPNALAAAYLSRVHDIQIGFAQWLLIGLPAAFVLLPLCWFMLSRALPGGGSSVSPWQETDIPSPLSRAELATAAVFLAAAFAWLTRPVFNDLWPRLPLGDTAIAIAAAVILFALPVRRTGGARLLGPDDLSALPWPILILFGGGLALAGAIADTGLAGHLGQYIAGITTSSAFLITVVLIAFIVLLTEITSNTATAAAFLPIAGATASTLGVDILGIVVPVTLAASCAFMMPVATPPNAVVFGSGVVTLGDMMRAGMRMNLIAMVVLAGIAWLVPWSWFTAA